jgi:hypothetical protein
MEKSIPILLLSAKNAWADIAAGLHHTIENRFKSYAD